MKKNAMIMKWKDALFCTALLLLTACASQPKKNGKATAKSQSAPYELLVVADKDWLKTAAGQCLTEVAGLPIPGLPQPEPQFRATFVAPHSFDGVFKTYVNVLRVAIGPRFSKPAISVQTDVYVRPQTIVTVCAPDDAAFATYIARVGQSILDRFNDNEFAREQTLLSKRFSGVVMRQAQTQFGAHINVPEEVDEVKTGESFFWASAGKQEFRLNVCVYAVPIQPWHESRWVDVRDSVMAVNIPGGRDGQWMETDRRTVMSGSAEVNGVRVAVLRGLWDMRDDAMGGPFVSYAFPDSVHGRILVAEGFALAPGKKKRPLIRKLEAALRTFRY